MNSRIVAMVVVLVSVVSLAAGTERVGATDYPAGIAHLSVEDGNTVPAAPTAGTTPTHVSVFSDETQGNGHSGRASISADSRYVAFESGASNLVAGDTNELQDIFVRDRQTGQTTRVSVASDGAQANDRSLEPKISADGRFVAFGSTASNLVPGDTNGYKDVFVHDRQTGQTTRVSVASGGAQGNERTWYHNISLDGRFVVFSSAANNLVPDDTNGYTDVFVHDRQTGQTTRVSVASDGAQGNRSSSTSEPSISADGRYVAFSSLAGNLVPGDTNDTYDVFVHDRQTGQTTRVSVASDGAQGNGITQSEPSISADGRHVAFESYASNLVPGDTNDAYDVFVHDRQTGQTTRVSVASDGAQANEWSFGAEISADGRYVAYGSDASDLVPGDKNTSGDVFVHDRQTGQTTCVSVTPAGTPGNELSSPDSIAADGRFVAFGSAASNLVPDDTNGYADVFVHDRQTGETELISRPTVPTAYAISGRVIDNVGTGIGVTAINFGSGTVTTDSNGDFTISGLMAGTYVLTPSKVGYSFSPASRTVTVGPSATGQDFIGTPDVATDTDGDGLPDEWEIYGYDHNGDGVVDVDLPAMGADWRHKDIFLEVDYMVQEGLCLISDLCLRQERSLRPRHLAIHDIVMAFHNAPVTNPNNTTGIHLHVDYGSDAPLVWGVGASWDTLSRSNELPYAPYIAASSDEFNWSDDYFLRVDFSEARRHIFHYALFADRLVPSDDPNANVAGLSLNDGDVVATEAPGQYILMTPGGGYQDLSVAGLLMHELGHNLQLGHGGGDDINHKPNYLSIMNYSFVESGLITDGVSGNYNFSPFGQVQTLEEFDLDERLGVSGLGNELDVNFSTVYFCDANMRRVEVGSAIDWNCNGSVEPTVVTDINKDGSVLGTLTSHDDWQNVVFSGGCIGRTGNCPSPLATSSLTPIAGIDRATSQIWEEPLPDLAMPHKILLSPSTTYIVSAAISSAIPISITNKGTEAIHVSLAYTTTSTAFDLENMPGELPLVSGQTVEIQLGIALNAFSGSGEFLTVTATIDENPNWVSETTIGVVRQDANIYLPLISRQ